MIIFRALAHRGVIILHIHRWVTLDKLHATFFLFETLSGQIRKE